MAQQGKFKRMAAGRKASLTPEEIQLRQIRAKRRFKALVLLVIANRPWLEEEGEDEQLGDNVLKNVKLLTRKKGKKSLLTKSEKSILNKPTECRTEAERARLDRVIGGLKCFRRYPDHVKSQLAAVTYFYYYGSGRVIIKQKHPAHAMYFILSGEVIVSQETWDPVLNETVTTSVGTMVAGEMFGEVSLLHNIPRTATITTFTPCELLCLKKDDFDIVLKDTVMEQWDKVIASMKRFQYFDGWDEVTQRECCIRAKLRSYSANQTILGDGVGLQSYTYFLLKGQCVLIEHMFVKVENAKGNKRYELVMDEPELAVEEEELASAASKLEGSKAPSWISTAPAEEEEEEKEMQNVRRASTELAKGRKVQQLRRDASSSAIHLESDVEVHFMQCCYFHETAVFGIGENFRRRRIVAATPVQCMLIPRYWLYQKNIGNIWSKVAQYLNTQIPSTKTLFEEFLEQRKWMKYRQGLVRDIVRQHKVFTGNSIHNVPYSIRLQDDLDIDYHPRK